MLTFINSTIDYKPFIVSGLALGSVYALSGVGLVTVFRTTGVLNFAYGAIGAAGAMLSWQLTHDGWPQGVSLLLAIVVAAGLSVTYGVLIAPRLSHFDAEVRATATLGFALILLGLMLVIWEDEIRSTLLPTDNSGFELLGTRISTTQMIAFGLAVAATSIGSLWLSRSRLGTAMRALASDREVAAILGVRVRRAELLAWAFGGALAGATGLLLASVVATEPTTLTYLVIASLAAALIGRMRSLWLTLAGGLLIGVLQAIAIPHEAISAYRDAAPFLAAIVVLLLLSTRRGAEGVRTR